MIMMSAHPRYLCLVIVEICHFHFFNIKGLPRGVTSLSSHHRLALIAVEELREEEIREDTEVFIRFNSTLIDRIDRVRLYE